MRTLARAWKISVPMRSVSAKVVAPLQMIISSWISVAKAACAPPLRTFIIGRGRLGVLPVCSAM